jgi:hypothetical protein
MVIVGNVFIFKLFSTCPPSMRMHFWLELPAEGDGDGSGDPYGGFLDGLQECSSFTPRNKKKSAGARNG